MTQPLDIFKPPLVQDGELCVGDKNLVRRLHDYFPDRVRVMQRNAPGPNPVALDDAAVWYDIQPTGVARIGADSGTVPNLNDTTLLKTAELITSDTELVTADWSGDTTEPLTVETYGDPLQPPTDARQQPSSTHDSCRTMTATGAPEDTAPASGTRPQAWEYQVQIASPDTSVVVEYRQLDTGDTGYITRAEYTSYLADPSTRNDVAATVIDLYETLALLELEETLDGIGIVWINAETHDFQLEEVIHPT